MQKRSKKHQQGFTAVEAAVVAVAIAAIGLGGWYLVHARSTPKTATNQTASNVDQQKSSHDTAGQYVTVPEWGVRFTVPVDLRGDISYFMNDRAEKLSGGPVLVDLLSKQFSAGSLKCQVVENNTPRSLVSIERITDSEGTQMSTQAFKRLGDAQYYFVGTACEETINHEGTQADKQLLTDIKDAVSSTLETY